MYTKIKVIRENIKEKKSKNKQKEMYYILNKRIYHLLFESKKEVNDIEITIKLIIDDINKL